MSLVMVSLCLGLLWAPGSAGASHSVGGFIGDLPNVANGGTPEGSFVQPRDVAVFVGTDSDPATDKILTVESANDRGRVQRLDRHGNFELMWGRDVVDGNAHTGFEVCTGGCRYGHPVADLAEGTLGGEFDDPQGLAVDQSTGRVFVHDRDNRRVQEFDLDGNFVRAFGWNVVQEATSDDTAGDQFETCFVAGECQAGVAGPGAGQLGLSSTNGVGVAVDPVNGNLFVADPGNRRVIEFAIPASDSDPVVLEDAFGSAGTGTNQFNTNMPLRIAVDANHVVYASDTSGSGRIHRYDAAANAFLIGGPIGTGGSLGNPLLAGGTGANSTSGLEVDPTTGNLYVLRDPSTGNTVVQELATPGGTPTEVLPRHDAGLGTTTFNGLGYNPATGEFHIVWPPTLPTGIAGTLILSESPGTLPAPVLSPSSAVGSDMATLNGAVDAAVGVSSYRFEVSTDGVTFTPVGKVGYVSGSGELPVSASVSGLDPNTLYRVRLVATKRTGLSASTTAVSSEGSFVTDSIGPDAQTLGATAIRSTAATLQGSVDPNAAPTSYFFEYGTTTGYGARVPAIDASAGAGASPKLVAEPAGGLQPDTIYHYRVVAENPYGIAHGADKIFQTRDVQAAGGRAFEMVSPPDKIGGAGVGIYALGDLGATWPGFASPVGDRYFVGSRAGSVLGDGSFSYAYDWLFSERMESGWVSRSPFTHPNYGEAYNRAADPKTFSDDFSLIVWGSNGGSIRLFPEMESWNPSYAIPTLGDWGGRYEVLAPIADGQGDGQPLGGGQAVSGDGSHAVVASHARGMANDPGPDGVLDPLAPDTDDILVDPTNDQAPNTFTLYAKDVSAGLSDTYPGAGVHEPVAVCTAGTLIPMVDGAGDLGSQSCQPPVEYAPGEFRDARLIDPRGASLGSMTDNVVSDDGSRIFFTTPISATGSIVMTACAGAGAGTTCPSQLYVRHEDESGNAVTRWISRPQVSGQDASLLGPAIFEGATPDGDTVYFRTASPLTADDPNGPCGAPCTTGPISQASWDLFEYDFTDDPGDDPGAGALTRVSGGPTGADDPNASAGSSSGGVPYSLRFVSSDGNRVLFATAAPLSGALQRDTGTITTPGGEAQNGSAAASASNLYLYASDRPVSERWEFVARLPRTSPLGGCATRDDGVATPIMSDSDLLNLEVLNGNCVRGSADGGLLTFWTDARLTVDDPDSVSGDVYAFDAVRGELTRVSAPQGGSGASYECATGVQCRGDIGIGLSARLGVATGAGGVESAFLQSKGRLTPDDLDDVYDVYRWRDGELSLVTPDTSTPAYYNGNSADGRDVFVMTRDRLSWQDVDSVADIYSWRADGGIPEPEQPVVCVVLVGGCHGAGGDLGSVDVASDAAGGSNAAPVADGRVRLSIASLGARARRRAARSGVVRLRVGAAEATTARLSARARYRARGRRVTRRLGGRRVVFARAGSRTVRLRLDRVTRRQLRSGRRVVLAVRVSARGADAGSVRLSLRRTGR